MTIQGMIETRSRSKAWYLKMFGGYRVLSVHSRPVLDLGTSVLYARSYVLVPESENETSELTAA